MTCARDLVLYERRGTVLPRVAAVHDLCGYGKCSLGIAIPVLSCAGIDVCAVPTSLFSAHTKFADFYMHDTTPMLGAYLDAWAKEGIELDGIYSGFLGSAEQVSYVRRLWREQSGALRIVDPVMGDGGKKYRTYTDEMCEATRALVAGADLLTPNLTEASILTGLPYEGQNVDENFVARMASSLLEMGAKCVVIKGVVRAGESVIRNYVACDTDDAPVEVTGELLPYMIHGTGDLFASALTAAVFAGKPVVEAVRFAGTLVRDAMRITPAQPDYELRGVSFESVLGEVTALLD